MTYSFKWRAAIYESKRDEQNQPEPIDTMLKLNIQSLLTTGLIIECNF